MIIYGEFLFAENFITTFLLLSLTAKLVGQKSIMKRRILASVLGAISSFMIFLSLTPFSSIALRIVSGILCVLVAFGRTCMIKITAIFFILTFTSGGIVMALMLWIQESAINHQGILYIESITYFKLLSIGVLAFGFTYWFIKLIVGRNIGSNIVGIAKLVIDENTYCLRAFVDSGNTLREPISGKPVILIDKKGAKKLSFEPLFLEERFGLIPYNAVGVENGVLEGVRLDKVIYKSKVIEGAFLAFYQGFFDEYEILLNNEFLEEGLLEESNTKTKKAI